MKRLIAVLLFATATACNNSPQEQAADDIQPSAPADLEYSNAGETFDAQRRPTADPEPLQASKGDKDVPPPPPPPDSKKN
jgi:hypothetical protein